MYGMHELDTQTGTGSAAAMAMARNWLNHCESEHHDLHNECPAPPDTPPPLPTRVIDVGDEQTPPRLVEVTGLRAAYCALSYCWGQNNAFVTTLASLNEHLSEIPMKRLFQTAREAIQAARQLQIQYLWIDSLCIIQDSADDWEREAEMMREIFSNARLVLCALDSKDGDGGLFRKREKGYRPHVQLTIPIPKFDQSRRTCAYATPRKDEQELLDRKPGPVDQRAWILQEEILVVRILYFGAGMLYWECLSLTASELKPDGGERGEGLDSRTKRLLLQGRPLHHTVQETTQEDKESQASLPYRHWEKVVEQYSTRAVTKQTDRIAAILGLGRLMESTLADQFVEGIWAGEHGLRSLCWLAFRPGSRIECFPSWSWASVTTPVEYSLLGSDTVRKCPVHWLAEILRFSPDLSCVRTGTQRLVTMRASLITVYEHRLIKDDPIRNRYYYADTFKPDRVKIDRDYDAPSSRDTYLVIARVNYKPHEEARLICLHLEPTTLGTDVYRRVGISNLPDDEKFWNYAEQNRVISIQ